LGSPTPDTATWDHSPDVPTWRYGDPKTREDGLCLLPSGSLGAKNRIAAARGKYVYAKNPISYMAALWPRRLKLRTFHAGAILAFFTSHLLPSMQSVCFRTYGSLRGLRRDGSWSGVPLIGKNTKAAPNSYTGSGWRERGRWRCERH